MKISSKAIVSNSDMIKNYKSCRDKAEELGQIYILKNNQPDAVLLSISKYEKLYMFIELMESNEGKDNAKGIGFSSDEGNTTNTATHNYEIV